MRLRGHRARYKNCWEIPLTNSVSAHETADIYKIPLLVGIVGHRDLVPEETPEIRAALQQLLHALRLEQPAVQLKLLSSMAEGADLLAADVARELDIDVIALLPYSSAQCRVDLAEDEDRQMFDRIMVHAEKLELPLPAGVSASEMTDSSAARDSQFQRAGAIIARYSSLLIAVWDGEDMGHAAGTARVVDFRRRGIAPAGIGHLAVSDTLLSAEDNDLIYEIRCSRRKTDRAGGEPPQVSVPGFSTGSKYYGDVERGMPPSLDTLLERTAQFNSDVNQYGEQISALGSRLAPPSPHGTPVALLYIDRLFKAADSLGVHFRKCFLRALAARYALWAVLAFLLIGFKKEYDSVFGLASIMGVLLIFALGWLLAIWAHRRSWHRRFVDYRALAEGLRVEFYWELAGVRAEFSDEFAHESFLQKQDVELEWIRAAMRAVSLRCALYPHVTWPNGFEHAFAAWIGDPDPVNGSGQLLYYRHRAKRLEKSQNRSDYVGHATLVGGLGLGLALAADAALRHFGSPLFSLATRTTLLWGLALLTVYGGIFEIYLSEKATRALIRQYKYMDSLFSFAASELRSARSQIEKLQIMRSLGHACLAEHAQWILAHRDKRIEGMRW
jgi:hypothetical protein